MECNTTGQGPNHLTKGEEMIQLEYKVRGNESDVTIVTIENKNFSMYNSPSDLLREVFPACDIEYVSGNKLIHFAICDDFNTYVGTMKGGKDTVTV